MVEGKRNYLFRDGILIHLNIMCNNQGRFNALMFTLIFSPYLPINPYTLNYTKVLVKRKRNNVVWPENVPYKSYKIGNFSNLI